MPTDCNVNQKSEPIWALLIQSALRRIFQKYQLSLSILIRTFFFVAYFIDNEEAIYQECYVRALVILLKIPCIKQQAG